MATNIFDFLNAISYNKQDILNDDNLKDYSPFVINKFLSGSVDALFYVNEVNQLPNLDKRMHYDFLRFSLRKAKRYNKWIKADKNETRDLIKKYYNCNNKVADEYSRLLADEQIEYIKQKLNTGGVQNKTTN